MSRGWLRFGVVLTVAWIVSLCAVATYEWQAPFYRKTVFFRVVPHPEKAKEGEAIPVTTPFLYDRFVTSLFLAPAGLWVLLLLGPSISWIRRGFKTGSSASADPTGSERS